MKTTYHTKKSTALKFFALESHGTEIAGLIGDFLARKVVK
jgi:hypothetical protein